MDLRAALGLSAAALELYRDKISLRQRPAAARNFKLLRNSTRRAARHFPYLLDFKAFLDIIINIYF